MEHYLTLVKCFTKDHPDFNIYPHGHIVKQLNKNEKIEVLISIIHKENSHCDIETIRDHVMSLAFFQATDDLVFYNIIRASEEPLYPSIFNQ